MSKNLEAALKYQEMGLSIIPIKANKMPYVKWEQFQTKRSDKNQIRSWWRQWPNANIGIVTGEVSGVNVVDVDTEAGWKALNEFLPDSLITPICKTPGGGYHVYFDYQPGLRNGVRVIEGCDLRTTGGYVIAPPSQNGDGQAYTWLDDLNIKNVDPQPMLDILFNTLLFYLKKQLQGKAKMVALGACMNKILRIVFMMLKNKSKYVVEVDSETVKQYEDKLEKRKNSDMKAHVARELKRKRIHQNFDSIAPISMTEHKKRRKYESYMSNQKKD